MSTRLRALVAAAGRSRVRRGLLLAGGLILLLSQIEGCYYMQAARGQLDLLNKRRPLDEVIADQGSPDELKARLGMIGEARQFSVDKLLLPDNESYRSYANLERDYVVWNVFAAPEFSLQAKRWCYPVAGCVAYRGYFSQDAAIRRAEKLDAKGYDTSVGGVSAYSTLGRFSDPVLNTMMRWTDADLVATLFHELAHQKLYVKGDTAFNESFATTVADIGIERWLASRGELDQLAARRSSIELRREIMALVEHTKTQLASLYESTLDDDDRREKKGELLHELSGAAGRTLADNGVENNWLAPPLNNARLASMGLYEGHVDAFRAIHRQCDEQLECFYRESTRLSELAEDKRLAALQRLASSAAGAGI